MKAQKIPASELPLNPDGSVYHLNLRPDQIADTIITVGDPGRVSAVTRHFDHIEHKVRKREFHTHTGRIGRKRLTVISTGIGPDNIDIVINELDALANINFKSRTVKAKKKVLRFIRLGTSGALHPDIPVDSLVVSAYGLGFDNLMSYYAYRPDRRTAHLLKQIHAYLGARKSQVPLPYLAKGSEEMVRVLAPLGITGITATCPGFYGPQGRRLRLAPKEVLPDLLSGFRYKDHRITNFEMETSALFGLSRLLGHQAVAVNTILANRATGAFTKRYKASVRDMIVKALEMIVQLKIVELKSSLAGR